jgi:hypothetical protein
MYKKRHILSPSKSCAPFVLEGKNERQSALMKSNGLAFSINAESIFSVTAPRQQGLLTKSAVLQAT